MRLVAHRGMNRRALENTLPAFELALEHADGIELDVQLARCGTPVVLHDERLDRLFEASGLVSDYTAEELSRLNARPREGHPIDAGERIPTLQEVLALIPDDYFVNIEIKAPRVARRTPTRAVAELLSDLGPRNYLVSSFNPMELARFALLCPKVPTGLLFHAESSFFLRHGLSAPVLARARLAALHPEWRLVSYDLVERAHARGLKVNVWTVNDPARAAWLQREGVDALISDVPDRLASELSGSP